MDQNQRLISHLGGAVVFLFDKTFIENEFGEAFQSTKSTHQHKTHTHMQSHTTHTICHTKQSPFFAAKVIQRAKKIIIVNRDAGDEDVRMK